MRNIHKKGESKRIAETNTLDAHYLVTRRISTRHKKTLENLEKPQPSENSGKTKSPVRASAKIKELIHLTCFA